MVLASPLFDAKGVMLLRRGTQLTATHLDRFKRWGVRAALVETLDGEAPDTPIDPELIAAIDQALDDKFAVRDDDEIMTEVKRIVRKMTIEEAASRRSSDT